MTETVGGHSSGGIDRPSRGQPHAPSPEEYAEAARHHRLEGEEWEPPSRPQPEREAEPFDDVDRAAVARYQQGEWMRANLTDLRHFHHGWLKVTPVALEFHRHRFEDQAELSWLRSSIRSLHVIDRDPTPKISTGPFGASITGYYDAWQVDVTNDADEKRMFVLWDPAQVEALRETFA